MRSKRMTIRQIAELLRIDRNVGIYTQVQSLIDRLSTAGKVRHKKKIHPKADKKGRRPLEELGNKDGGLWSADYG